MSLWAQISVLCRMVSRLNTLLSCSAQGFTYKIPSRTRFDVTVGSAELAHLVSLMPCFDIFCLCLFARSSRTCKGLCDFPGESSLLSPLNPLLLSFCSSSSPYSVLYRPIFQWQISTPYFTTLKKLTYFPGLFVSSSYKCLRLSPTSSSSFLLFFSTTPSTLHIKLITFTTPTLYYPLCSPEISWENQNLLEIISSSCFALLLSHACNEVQVRTYSRLRWVGFSYFLAFLQKNSGNLIQFHLFACLLCYWKICVQCKRLDRKHEA